MCKFSVHCEHAPDLVAIAQPHLRANFESASRERLAPSSLREVNTIVAARGSARDGSVPLSINGTPQYLIDNDN